MKIQGVPQLHPPSTAKTLEDIYLNNNSVGKLLLSNEIQTQYHLFANFRLKCLNMLVSNGL